MHGLVDFKGSFQMPSKIEITEKPHTVLPRTLISNSQQEVSKFNDIYVSQGFPKTELGTNFLNLGSQNFENVSFSQQ